MKRVQYGIAAASLGLFALPVAAFADEGESISGADLLIPKPAEFFPALIIFLIIWFLLAKFAWPKILGALDAREERISSDIKEADQLKADAAHAKQEAQQLVVDAHRQASDIVLKARRDAEDQRAKIVQDARIEGEQIVSEAKDRAVREQRLMYDHATDSIAKVSVAVASKIVDEKLSTDPELQRKVIKKYLAEVGSYNA